jgi:serine/threonine protein kinase
MRELSLNNCRLDKRYDVQELLGRGSYAEIFVARDVLASVQSPHNTVVIKALNVFLQNDVDSDLERTLVENFQNEAVALDLVRHPNIISRLGHGTARDLKGSVFHYLVLEYLAGGDMQKLCREEKLILKRSIKYTEQVCAGLRYAHEKGVIHRDIKPHNLLLTKDRETVKIADFGVARLSDADTPITRVGTNIYAPPEHSPLLSGQNGTANVAKLTPAADIYSLAKTMYSMVTCESPRYFANQPISSLPVAFREEKWADEFLRLLNKATQDDPELRHQSIDEFWIDMTELRNLADRGEVQTAGRIHISGIPQAHVARGYTPLAPTKPHFETTGNLKLRNPARSGVPSMVTRSADFIKDVPQPQPMQRVENYWPQDDPESHHTPPQQIVIEQPVVRRSGRRAIRRAGAFLASIILFGGVLYSTGSFLRGRGYLPSFNFPWHTQTATANTDIYLRPDPSTNNDPVGLVTRNSKLRIVNSQNNWYQVDVVEQGRDRASPNLTATHGWLNGKYIDIDD